MKIICQEKYEGKLIFRNEIMVRFAKKTKRNRCIITK